MTGLVLAAGAVTWLVTLILVEGFITKPLRDWPEKRRIAAADRYALARQAILRHRPDPRIHVTGEVAAQQGRDLDLRERRLRRADRATRAWYHAAYFVRCHLCLGTWVALILTALPGMPRPFTGGVLGWLLAALVVKAVAHLTLEVVAVLKRAAYNQHDPGLAR